MDDINHSPTARKRGRPRNPDADRRILAAARMVAGEVGVRAASMSAIADRCGVGKPTIYLRWSNRADLMVAALADLRAPVVIEHTGSPRDDLLHSLREDEGVMVTGEHAPFLRSVLFESFRDPALKHEFEAGVSRPRRDRLKAIIDRGVRDGRLRPVADPGAIADMLTAPLLRSMVLALDATGPDVLRAHVDTVVDGIGTAASAAA